MGCVETAIGSLHDVQLLALVCPAGIHRGRSRKWETEECLCLQVAGGSYSACVKISLTLGHHRKFWKCSPYFLALVVIPGHFHLVLLTGWGISCVSDRFPSPTLLCRQYQASWYLQSTCLCLWHVRTLPRNRQRPAWRQIVCEHCVGTWLFALCSLPTSSLQEAWRPVSWVGFACLSSLK